MIPKRDSKPIKIKFAVGVSKTNKIDMVYQDEWETIFGLIGTPSGAISKQIYGYELDFDKIITVNASSVTRMINYDTLFLIDNMPTSVYDGGDYSVRYIYPEYNGEIVIGLSKKEAVNIPKLYFERNGNILYYQLNFDKNTLKAYVPVNFVLPFEEGDYLWIREPVDSSVTKHRVKFNSKSKTGLYSHFKNFYELSFTEE